MAMAAASPSLPWGESKRWWLTNRKIAERYVREAKMLIAAQGEGDILAATGLLDSALALAPRMELALAPRMELALELRARCLLFLRRFKEVADMLQDYIPSVKVLISDDSVSSGLSENLTTQLSRERVRLLPSGGGSLDRSDTVSKCFSVADLKKKVLVRLRKNAEKEGLWRYSVLGQACGHLGLMEDALVLLRTGKRLAAAASRRESVSLSDDVFTSIKFPLFDGNSQNHPRTEFENITHLICQIKLLVRRKTAAMAALDAGHYSEAIRHFSKIVEGRRGAPQAFLSECYVHRAVAFQSAGRIAEAIADCNRALALDTSCVEGLTVRATLFETIKCLPDCLHDLEHLKLLYNTILRDRKLPGPAWKRQNVQHREIPGKLCSLAAKMQRLKLRVVAGETNCVDYYALLGLRRGCSSSEAERAHLLLTLKHRPDKSLGFIERCEFSDGKEADSVRDRANLSAHLLYRLVQKGHTSVVAAILNEEAAEKLRKKAAAISQQVPEQSCPAQVESLPAARSSKKNIVTTSPASVYKGAFCRDLSAVGNLLSQAAFHRSIPVKYEALSC